MPVRQFFSRELFMGNILSKSQVRCLLALLCCALWCSAFPCIKIGYEWLEITTVGSQILFAGYRFFLAGIATFAVGCIIEKRILTIKKESIPHICGIGFLQTTVEYFFFYIGMSNITGTQGSIINGSSTFFAIVLAHFIIKGERLTWEKSLGCLIGFAGVLLVNIGGITSGEISFMGEGMMLISTAAYGMSSTLVKFVSHRGTPMAITAFQLTFGGFLLIVLGFVFGGNIGNFDMKSILLMAYMVFISAAAFSIWTALLKYNQVGKVTIFGFCIPVFGVILSGLFLGENIFALRNILALACVCVGIIIVNRQKS
jgi:drug/metabolite transporter (DMT)-like permease